MGVSYGGLASPLGALRDLVINRGANLPLHRIELMASARLKSSKSEARYQHHPMGNKFCVKCTMFKRLDSCTKVAGSISTVGYCRFYFPKGDK